MEDIYTEGISSEQKIQRAKALISKTQDILSDEIKKAKAILGETKQPMPETQSFRIPTWLILVAIGIIVYKYRKSQK